MKWECKLCGFDITDREDKRKVKIKDDNIYIIGFCDNCTNWTILDIIPMEQMKEYIYSKLLLPNNHRRK